MSPKEIARAARWHGTPQRFVSALKACGGKKAGFLEEANGRLILHDWEQKQIFFAENEARRVDRDRKRAQRQRLKNEPDHDGRGPDAAEGSAQKVKGSVQDNVQASSGTLSHESPTPEERKGEQSRSDLKTPPTPQGGSDGFDAFWAVYPKHVGKKAALKTWVRLNPSSDLQERICAAVRVQREWPQWTKDGGQFIPNPTTWLNQGRWEDEPPTPSKGQGRDLSRFKKLMEDQNGDENSE
jgi:hypothetical protein